MKQALTLIIVILLIVVAVFLFPFGDDSADPNQEVAASSFEECVAQGNAVMESYPRQCRDAAGNLHVEDVTASWEVSYVNASEDLIRNVSVEAGDTISSPYTITGTARGYWYFEATFPVMVVDWDGRIIEETFATAETDWMTEDFVPFTTTIEFDTPAGPGGPINRGAIILQRSNASGLPKNDAALEIPIVFE